MWENFMLVKAKQRAELRARAEKERELKGCGGDNARLAKSTQSYKDALGLPPSGESRPSANSQPTQDPLLSGKNSLDQRKDTPAAVGSVRHPIHSTDGPSVSYDEAPTPDPFVPPIQVAHSNSDDRDWTVGEEGASGEDGWATHTEPLSSNEPSTLTAIEQSIPRAEQPEAGLELDSRTSPSSSARWAGDLAHNEQSERKALKPSQVARHERRARNAQAAETADEAGTAQEAGTVQQVQTPQLNPPARLFSALFEATQPVQSEIPRSEKIELEEQKAQTAQEARSTQLNPVAQSFTATEQHVAGARAVSATQLNPAAQSFSVAAALSSVPATSSIPTIHPSTHATAQQSFSIPATQPIPIPTTSSIPTIYPSIHATAQSFEPRKPARIQRSSRRGARARPTIPASRNLTTSPFEPVKSKIYRRNPHGPMTVEQYNELYHGGLGRSVPRGKVFCGCLFRREEPLPLPAPPPSPELPQQ